MTVCSVDGCGKEARAKSLCKSHYTRLLKYGDPVGISKNRAGKGSPQNLIRKLTKEVGPQCIFWPYGKNQYGYGVARIDGKAVLVHRYLCEIANGSSPPGKTLACHSCGNGHLGCVNINHLRWDSQFGNKEDELGHQTRKRGEKHGMAVLSERDVREIRKLSNTISAKALSLRFGVSQSHIYMIKSHRTWAWLDAEED